MRTSRAERRGITLPETVIVVALLGAFATFVVGAALTMQEDVEDQRTASGKR